MDKFLEFYNTKKNDLFNTCMHLSNYKREDALVLLKMVLVELLVAYEKGVINGKGTLEKTKEAIVAIKEGSHKERVTDLLDYKNSSERESKINKLNFSINNLPENQREIIKEHYINGKSYETIAKELDKKPGALRTMACRTMQKLKDELS